MKNELIIVGAGGLAKMVIDALRKSEAYKVIGVFVDGYEVGSLHPIGLPVLAELDGKNFQPSSDQYFIVALGDNKLREKLTKQYSSLLNQATVVHPSAVIADDVVVGEGVIILANSTINSGSIIGKNCLINSGVVIDHDCNIGQNSHLKIGTLVSSKTVLPVGFESSSGQLI
jgi:sugar O-acyltransferase (sialic acid O-acetyltransferase NeuD family)